jgi:hypothetical protein
MSVSASAFTIWSRSATTPSANPFAMSRARSGESAVARIATMLLWATGSAFTSLSRSSGLSFRPSLSITRLATLRLVTTRLAVSTSRVGSLDSRMIGSPSSAFWSRLAGITSKSASARYLSVATARYAAAIRVVTSTISPIRPARSRRIR